MLTKERIKQAKTNVNNYITEGMIKKVKEINQNIINVYVKNSEESLKVANHLLKEDISTLWVIVPSYYSMYYIANAVLYNLGYKIGHKISHKITADSLITFVRKKLKDNLIEDYEKTKDNALELAGIKTDKIIKSFDFEKNKRGRFQYNMTENVKKAKAKTSLERAKVFASEMERLLE